MNKNTIDHVGIIVALLMICIVCFKLWMGCWEIAQKALNTPEHIQYRKLLDREEKIFLKEKELELNRREEALKIK
jgi:hypothetical protein